jgi:hypothetical protein
MAEIVPFPLARRRLLVTKCARRMLELDATTADEHLQRQLQVQADTMGRRGIAVDLIDRQLKSMESAVRAEIWRAMFALGGAA